MLFVGQYIPKQFDILIYFDSHGPRQVAILWTHHHRMALLCRLRQVVDAHFGAPEHHHGAARQRDAVVHPEKDHDSTVLN